MKPGRFDYVRPDTLDAALAALGSDEEAKVLAGGQSLIPMMNLRLARPPLLVDVGRLAELREVRRENGTLVIGAGVRQRDVERSTEAQTLCPLLRQALRHVGHPQIRARGTVGGSIAHADPAAELCAAALALDASVVAVSPRGTRAIDVHELLFGPFMTTLEDDEILTEVRLPVLDGVRTAFVEVARRSGDFAIAGVATVVRIEAGRAADVRLAGLGIGATAQRLTDAERLLRGEPLTPEAAARAGTAAAAEVDPVDDLHADAPTRRAALAAMVERALAEVMA